MGKLIGFITMAKRGKQHQTQGNSCGAQHTSSSASTLVDSRRRRRLSFQALPASSYSQRLQAASGWSGRASLGRPCRTSATGWGRMPRKQKHRVGKNSFLGPYVISAQPRNSNRCSEVLQVLWYSRSSRCNSRTLPTDPTMVFLMDALGAASQLERSLEAAEAFLNVVVGCARAVTSG